MFDTPYLRNVKVRIANMAYSKQILDARQQVHSDNYNSPVKYAVKTRIEIGFS